MKLKKGKSSYPLPTFGMVTRVLIDEGVREMKGSLCALTQVSKEMIDKMRSGETLRGRPTYFHLTETSIEIFPVPDRGGNDLKVIYYPPKQEC